MKMNNSMSAVWGFMAGVVCGAAAISMTSDQTMRKIKRRATRTIRTVGDMASDLADIVR